MRFFFLLLLATNILFFSWQFMFETGDEKGPAPYGGVKVVNNGLPLLSELSEGQRPSPRKMLELNEVKSPEVELVVAGSKPIEVSLGEALPVMPQKQCYQSTPFDSEKEAHVFQKKLTEAGIESSQLDMVQVQNKNYWVMLKPYDTGSKAEAAADILKKNRIRDFFIVRTGQYINAVSLGVYSSKERAEARRKEIVDLKVRLRKPVIELLDLPAKRYLIHFNLNDKALPEPVKLLIGSKDVPLMKKIACN